MRARIVVRLHEREAEFESREYLLPFLMREWAAMGLEVRTVRGAASLQDSDVILPHIDLTCVPPEYTEPGPGGAFVVNRGVADISKSRLSAHLVRPGDGFGGPVIVKTDANCGGLPDKRLRKAGLSLRLTRLLSGLWQRATKTPLWRWVDYLDPDDYAVFPSVREVPSGVFRNRSLIVEQYLPEMADGAYCVRYCYFLGDREISLRLTSRSGIVKASNAARIEEVSTPENLREIRRRLGFDYGKFDYALRGGEVVLYDANRTPGTETLQRCGLTEKVAGHLAPGILPLLGGRPWDPAAPGQSNHPDEQSRF